MPAVGSRRKTGGVVWSIIIPEHLALRFETLYMDTSKQKPIYGIKAQIMSELLEQHVSQIEAEHAERILHDA